MSVKRVRCRFHAKDPAYNRPDHGCSCKCCPRGRSGHRIVVTDNCVYSIGGFNPLLGNSLEPTGNRGFPLLKELWKFNLSTQKWQLVDDYFSVPSTIASHTVCCVGRWLFLFGGTSVPFGDTPSNSVYRYNLSLGPHPLIQPKPTNNSTNDENGNDNEDGDDSDEEEEDVGREVEAIHPSRSRWNLIPVEGDIPQERYGHTMTLKYPDVYIVGGTSGHIYNTDVFHLELKQPTGKWSKLSWDGDPNQPVGRYRHETAFDGRKLYVFGGGTDRDAFSLIMVHTFDVVDKCWQSVKTTPDVVHGYPRNRKCHSCCQLDNDVFLAGGISGHSRQNLCSLLDDIWRFSLSTLEWNKLSTTLPQPVYFHSADICKNKGLMYVFGGVMTNETGTVRTRQLWSVRVGVSSLLELAWDVLCESMSDNCTKDLMTELDVPLQLLDRL